MITRRHFGAAALVACAGPLRAEPAPMRVVSAGGAFTEIVFRLDAQALLVGTDTTSIFPAAAAALPQVGYLRQLSAEGVLSLKPTLLLTASETGPPTVLQQLRAAGVQIVQGDGRHSIEALRGNVRLLGDALQRAERGHALDAELQRDWAATQAAITRGTPAPRVLFVLSHAATQVHVAGTDTAGDAMIRYAGGVNVMSAASGWPPRPSRWPPRAGGDRHHPASCRRYRRGGVAVAPGLALIMGQGATSSVPDALRRCWVSATPAAGGARAGGGLGHGHRMSAQGRCQAQFPECAAWRVNW